VLLLAEAANPEWASVPLIGWSLSQAIAKVADAHLVTHVRNRDALLRAGLREDADFTAIDNEAVAKPLWRLSDWLRGGEGRGWTTVMALAALAYYAFEHEVWRRFSAQLARGDFELVHRITPVSPTNQSLIAGKLAKRGIPFILGPINGGIPWPKGFAGRQAAEREWLSSLRALYKLLPGYRSTLVHSAAIIAGSSHVYDALPAWTAEKRVFIPENAVDLVRFSGPRMRKAAIPLRVIFVGRLVPYKCADLLIEGSAPFQRQGLVELTIVGDGPERARLEALALQLGVERTTRFDGWTPHEDIAGKLRESDLLALPSVREFGGGVVLEAMAMGVAPLVANYGGPADLVDDSVGIRVPFEDKASLVEGLSRALAEIGAAPGRLDVMGAAGRARVLRDFTWEAKAGQILEVYEAALANAPVSSRGLPRPSKGSHAEPAEPLAKSA
jgi:glycosyltransferase involved in cell wall biosynthesis